LSTSSPKVDRHLALACGALGFSVLGHISVLPMWISLLFIVALATRLRGLLQGRPVLRRMLLASFAVGSSLIVLANFRTLNGLTAGTALLVAMAALKVVETERPRDYATLAFIIFFLSLASLLRTPSPLRLVHGMACAWLGVLLLLETQRPPNAPALSSARQTARLLGLGLPLALILFIFVPRLEGRFWAVPSGGSEATSGVAEEMNPGAIAKLALSDEPAFRVRFDGPMPSRDLRYWRVLALDSFDGQTWRRSPLASAVAPARTEEANAPIRYTIDLEASHQAWLPSLDRLVDWSGLRARREADGTLVQLDADGAQALKVDSLTSYSARSSPPAAVHGAVLDAPTLRRNLALPAGSLPRGRALARQLRADSPDVRAYIARVLAYFRNEPFAYTLEPPPLGPEPVDEFLFVSRAGFCEHYASAFVALMRAAGIPARVVIGYQGGDLNAYGNFLLVRQSAAHAWAEVWLDDEGWQRFDPTAAIAPERIRAGLDGALPEAEARRYRHHFAWVLESRAALDALKAGWDRLVVGYSSRQQARLLDRLGWIGDPLTGLATLLAGGFALTALVLIAMQITLAPRGRSDRVQQAWELACGRLARRGLRRGPAEGPLDFARRVRAARPADGPAFDELVRWYIRVRYERAPVASDTAEFIRRARRFRP
jgi:protein-glutamine gamma-glutamyltransferase